MQFDDVADDDQRRRLDAGFFDALRQGAERGEQCLLVGQGAVADDGRWGQRRQAVVDHLPADFAGGANAHVEDDRLVGPGEGWPVEIHRTVLEVAGDEGDGLCVVAVREWKAGIGGTAGSGGHAGHDLEGNAGRGQSFQFLAAAAEDEGVATLKANDRQAFARQVDQQVIDRFLRQGVFGRFLAGVDAPRIRARQIHDAVADQMIEDQVNQGWICHVYLVSISLNKSPILNSRRKNADNTETAIKKRYPANQWVKYCETIAKITVTPAKATSLNRNR